MYTPHREDPIYFARVQRHDCCTIINNYAHKGLKIHMRARCFGKMRVEGTVVQISVMFSTE